jgi:hypothetical protein
LTSQCFAVENVWLYISIVHVTLLSSLLHSESIHMLLMYFCIVEEHLCDVCKKFGNCILGIYVLE